MSIEYMNFGKLSKTYDAARHIYPKEVMDCVSPFVDKSSKVLDVGCGTGIATRQLAQKINNIYGCDIDTKMIETAQNYKDSIKYLVAPTREMPFTNEQFDAVVSFGAFHWFCDDKSLTEIKRVLKNDGFFIVINKNEAGDFRKNYEEILEKFTGTKPPQSIKSGYHPLSILKQGNFSEVTENKFLHIEKFSIPRAIEQIQSMSLWNLIQDGQKQLALKVFKSHFEKIAKDGVVHRQLETVVVTGKKQE